jgi:hypothetical protein
MKYIKLLEVVDDNIHSKYSLYQILHKYLEDKIDREYLDLDSVTLEYYAPLVIKFTNGWKLTISGSTVPLLTLYKSKDELSIHEDTSYEKTYRIITDIIFNLGLSTRERIEFMLEWRAKTRASTTYYLRAAEMLFQMIMLQIDELNQEEVWKLLDNPYTHYISRVREKLEELARKFSNVDDYLY